MSFATLLLAAGRSSRMGTPKAWLRFGQTTCLEHIMTCAYEAGSHALIIVVGSEDNPGLVSRQDVLQCIPANPACPTHVILGNPLGEPIDSIRCGLRILTTPSRLLLWPVDAPFANTALVAQLRDCFTRDEDKIARPTVGQRHGHPILLGATAARELREDIADAGAHHVVHRCSNRLIDLPCHDERLVAPLNTPQDARATGITLPQSARLGGTCRPSFVSR